MIVGWNAIRIGGLYSPPLFLYKSKLLEYPQGNLTINLNVYLNANLTINLNVYLNAYLRYVYVYGNVYVYDNI